MVVYRVELYFDVCGYRWLPALLRSLSTFKCVELKIWGSSPDLSPPEPITIVSSPLQHLTTFRTDSPIFLSSALITWLKTLLNTAPLRVVELCSMELSQSSWIRLLKKVTLPQLRELTLDGTDISSRALLTFLGRHPLLEELVLGPSLAPWTSVDVLAFLKPASPLTNFCSLSGALSQTLAILSLIPPAHQLTTLNLTILKQSELMHSDLSVLFDRLIAHCPVNLSLKTDGSGLKSILKILSMDTSRRRRIALQRVEWIKFHLPALHDEHLV